MRKEKARQREDETIAKLVRHCKEHNISREVAETALIKSGYSPREAKRLLRDNWN